MSLSIVNLSSNSPWNSGAFLSAVFPPLILHSSTELAREQIIQKSASTIRHPSKHLEPNLRKMSPPPTIAKAATVASKQQVRRPLVSLMISGAALLVPICFGLSSAQNSCHLRELDLCATSLLVFAQSPGGLATSDQEIQKQCTHLRDASQCFKNYTRRCMTPMQREVLNLASNSTLQLVDDYCSKGSNFRQHYLKHSACLNQVYKKQEYKTCTRDLQASLELLAVGANQASQKHGETNGKRLNLACCAYRRFESCLAGQMERRCGKETVQFVASTVRRATSRLPDNFCRHLKADGQECRALLPKPGTAPKGSKSNSIVSRLLAAYSGL